MPEISFTILGSSAGMPQPDRINSGYVLRVNNRLIQLDCGGGISHAFRKAGFDPLNVERIVISHMHPDHVCDLPLCIQMQYLAGRREPITVHLPEEASQPVRTTLESMYIIEPKLSFELIMTSISEKNPIRSDDLIIHPIANTHLHKYAEFIEKYSMPNRRQCYSFLISVDGKRLLYSADLGSEQDIRDHLDNLDLLVIESTHVDLGVVLDTAAEKKIGRIILTHIAEDFDTEAARISAQKQGVDNFYIAHDGMTLRL